MDSIRTHINGSATSQVSATNHVAHQRSVCKNMDEIEMNKNLDLSDSSQKNDTTQNTDINITTQDTEPTSEINHQHMVPAVAVAGVTNDPVFNIEATAADNLKSALGRSVRFQDNVECINLGQSDNVRPTSAVGSAQLGYVDGAGARSTDGMNEYLRNCQHRASDGDQLQARGFPAHRHTHVEARGSPPQQRAPMENRYFPACQATSPEARGFPAQHSVQLEARGFPAQHTDQLEARGFPAQHTDQLEARGFPAQHTDLLEARGFRAQHTDQLEARGFPAQHTDLLEARGFPAQHTDQLEARGFPAQLTDQLEARDFPARRTSQLEARGFPAQQTDQLEAWGFPAQQANRLEARGFPAHHADPAGAGPSSARGAQLREHMDFPAQLESRGFPSRPQDDPGYGQRNDNYGNLCFENVAQRHGMGSQGVQINGVNAPHEFTGLNQQSNNNANEQNIQYQNHQAGNRCTEIAHIPGSYSGRCAPGPGNYGHYLPNIDQLRANQQVSDCVSQRMLDLGLCEDGVDGSYDKSDRRKGKKSGLSRTVEDQVLKEIDWPHFYIYRGQDRRSP